MKKKVIMNNPEKCKFCYKCVQSCFTKAIKIKDKSIEIDYDRCVNCGFCIRNCSLNIPVFITHKDKVYELLKDNKNTYALVDENFRAAFKSLEYYQLKSALKKMGFKDVIDTSLGTSLYAYISQKFFKKNNKSLVLEAKCAPFVKYLLSYYPGVSNLILPYHTPIVISAKIMRERFGEDCHIVLINNCFSDLIISEDENPVDYTLSFEEIKEMLAEENINPYQEQEVQKKHTLYTFIKNVDRDSIDSFRDCKNLLDFVKNGGRMNKIATPYWCHGTCYGNLVADHDTNNFERKAAFLNYMKECDVVTINDKTVKQFGDLERFRYKYMPTPIMEKKYSEDEIRKVLISMGRNKKEDEFNCGACGYPNCRENAVAILNGMSPAGHCIPFINDKKEEYSSKILKVYNELDNAFALTIPNTKLEHKLKTTPEYKDTYIDGDKDKIRIVSVIPDGTYRHVVNALMVAANLKNKGIMNLVGIDKDTMVQVIIFHDIGKTQPTLKVNDEINPREAFEDGKLHAKRSAELARKFYHISDDVYNIIKYHHHKESELDDDFPDDLLVMYRLFKKIDGISAGLTRRDSNVNFALEGSTLYIKEDSQYPKYRKIFGIDLYKDEKYEKEYSYDSKFDFFK